MIDLIGSMRSQLGSGDGFSRENIYSLDVGLKDKWEGFGTPTRINHSGPRVMPQVSWAQILEERKNIKSVKDIPPPTNRQAPKASKPCAVYSVNTGEIITETSMSRMCVRIGVSCKKLSKAIRKRSVCNGFISWLNDDAPSMDEIKRIADGIGTERARNRGQFIDTFAYNVRTGETVKNGSSEEMALFLGISFIHFRNSMYERKTVKWEWIVWNARRVPGKAEMEDRIETSLKRLERFC